MSMILDALRRSGNEPVQTPLRQRGLLGEGSDLQESGAAPGLLRKVLPMAALLAMFATAIIIGWWLGQRSSPDGAAVTGLADVPSVQADAVDVRVSGDDVSEASQPVQSDTGSVGGSTIDSQRRVVEGMSTDSALEHAHRDTVGRSPDAAVLALYAAGTPSETPEAVGENTSVLTGDESAATDRARSEAESGADQREEALAERIASMRSALQEPAFVSHPAPFLETLSQQQKDNIPSLFYSAHRSGAEAVAEVVINGDRLRVGQRSGDIEVVEILPDSAVLSYRGVVFRLPALNSWVNL
jgi:general secretion pathway protein B